MTSPRIRRYKRLRRGRETDADNGARDRRQLVDRFTLWAICGRPACARAKACRERDAPCFNEELEFVQDCIVDETAEWYRLAGISEDLLPETEFDDATDR
jgi:hypothetical protein